MVFEETWYFKELEHEEGGPFGYGDYSYIELVNVDTKDVIFFGDYYHDKGSEKLEGFLKGLTYAGFDYTIKHQPDALAGS